MATVQNPCACPSAVVTEIPGVEGATGAAGTNGSNGVNAYTLTNSTLTIPTTGSTVAQGMANVSWMVVGQYLFISDGTNFAHFQVTALQASPPVATLKALGNNGDSAATVVIGTGASVSPSGVQGTTPATPAGTDNSATGGSQAITATPAQALSVTTTLSGTAGKLYMLFARVRVDYAGATFAAVQTVTLTIRRTNNTAGNIISKTIALQVVTTSNNGVGEITACTPYTGAGVSDIVQCYISVSVIPSAGALNVVEASITALQLN